MDWMADVIPRRLRGRFFGSRNRLGQWVSAPATLGIGWAVDLASSTNDRDLLLRVTSAILAIAGLAGALDVLRFLRVRDPQRPPTSAGPGLLETLRQPLMDRDFRRYAIFNFTFNVAVGFIGQYAWLYILERVAFPAWQANLLLIAVPAVLFSLMYRFWGRVIDRFGKKPVLLICGAVIIHGSWGWTLVGHGAWPVNIAGHTFSLASVIGYGVTQMAVLCWPGFEIANFNFLLGLAGSSEGRRGGSAYVAVYSIAVALGGMLSGLIGGLVAARLGDFAWMIPIAGIVMSYHGLLFVLSAGLRVVAMLVLVGVHEPRALPTRDALRYVTTNLYNNAVEVLHWPTRIAGQAYRLTYRFTPRS
jgi:MFS family permease